MAFGKTRAVALTALLLAGAAGGRELLDGDPTASAQGRLGEPQTLVGGLDLPWGLAFLPDGSALVVANSDTGRIIRVTPQGNGARSSTALTVPGVNPEGEGGLLGLAVSPTYARDKWVYAYMSTRRDNRVVRFKLGDRRLRVLVKGIPHAAIHNGGRLAFGPDKRLYVSTGDAAAPARSQSRRSLGGKILRVTTSGKAAPGNPGGRRVFTLGHRNVQGLAWDAQGRMFASELGQNTFDEVNRIVRGRNYGWPAVEGRGTGGGRYTSPVVTWSTAEASPSGAAVLGSTLYVAALRGQRLWQIPLSGGRTGEPVAALRGDLGRLRTVVPAPDGQSLWLLTSNGGGGDELVRVPVG